MAKAQSQSFDLSDYDYDPSSPLPSDRVARNHVIAQGPCQPKDPAFPKDRKGLTGSSTPRRQIKRFAFIVAHSIGR